MSRARLTLVGAGVAVVLAGCASTPDGTDPEPNARPTVPLEAPVPVGTPAPEVDVDPAMLPYAYEDSPAVAPGWSTAPLHADGMFVAPDPDGVVAVDTTGTVLWRANGPADTWVGLTSPDGEPLVVLAAPGPDGTWTARAHELESGAAVWGPVTWPGAPTGTGLVVDGPEGPVAVDARSGELLPAPDGATPVAERDGVVVHQAGQGIRARADGATVWTATMTDLRLPADADVAAVAGARTPPGTVLLGDAADGPATGTLLRAASGEVLAADVRDVHRDELFGTLVVLGPGVLTGLEGAGSDGGSDGTVTEVRPAWSRPVPEDARLTAVGGALAYLRAGDRVLAVNTATGADAEAYGEPGPAGFAVPAVTGEDGATALRTDVWVLLTAPRR